MLGISELHAGGSPMQELVNQKPIGSTFIKCLSSVVSGHMSSLFSHSLTVKGRGENFADSYF